MKKTIDEGEFVRSFDEYNRSEDFTIEARRAMYAYLTELEEETDIEQELDPIAACCEYSEYDSAYEAMEQYQPEDMPMAGEEGDDLVEVQSKTEHAALDWLQERTTVIPVGDTGRVVIAQF